MNEDQFKDEVQRLIAAYLCETARDPNYLFVPRRFKDIPISTGSFASFSVSAFAELYGLAVRAWSGDQLMVCYGKLGNDKEVKK